MRIVVCDICDQAMVYAIKDLDGVNLEEVYECECGNYVFYDDTQNFSLSVGDTVGYHGREAQIKKIGRFCSSLYFSDINETIEVENNEIVDQHLS